MISVRQQNGLLVLNSSSKFPGITLIRTGHPLSNIHEFIIFSISVQSFPSRQISSLPSG